MGKREPEWIKSWGSRHAAYFRREMATVELSTKGIGQLSRGVALTESLARLEAVDGVVPEEWKASIEESRRLAKLADAEMDTGFTTVHSHSLVALWGAVELAIENAIVLCVENDGSLLSTGSFAAVQVRVGEFLALDDDMRLRFLVQEALRKISRPRAGVTAFEDRLDLIGLSGAVDQEMRQQLFELYHLRNAIVHRGGVVDARLVEACSWLSLTVGDPVRIDHADYVRYATALVNYVVLVLTRIEDRYGEKIEDVSPPADASAAENTDLH